MPPVEGEIVVPVKGDIRSLVALKAGCVMIGGKVSAGFEEKSNGLPDGASLGGLSPTDGLDFWSLFVVGIAGAPKVKAPGPPKLIRLEKLLLLVCAADPLLEVVDCDQRLRFPTPSRTPLTLFERLCDALGRRRDSGELTSLEKFEVVFETYAESVLGGAADADRVFEVLGPIDSDLCIVAIDDDEELLVWFG